MSDVGTIADAVKEGDDRGAVLRIGTVTEVEVSSGRVRLNTTGSTWLQTDAEAAFEVGERAYAFLQGPTGIVAGKLAMGSTGTPVGVVLPYAGVDTTLPTGWLKCDGRAVSRTTYALLFSRLGTTFGGGDGSTTFNIPNMVGRFPFGADASDTRGETGGAKTVTLSMAQMPAHNHGADGAHTHTVPAYGPETIADGTTAVVASEHTSGTNTSSSAGTHTHNTEGSSSAHENMPPWMGLHYIIRAT